MGSQNVNIYKIICLLLGSIFLYIVVDSYIEIIFKFIIIMIIIIVLASIVLLNLSYNVEQKIQLITLAATLTISLMSIYLGFINSSEIKSSFSEPDLNITHNCFSKNESFGEIFNVFVNHINPGTKSISLGIQIPDSLKISSHEASEGGTPLRPKSWQGNFAIEYSWKVESGYQANLTLFYEKNYPDFVNSERTLTVNDEITKPKSNIYDCKNKNDWIN